MNNILCAWTSGIRHSKYPFFPETRQEMALRLYIIIFSCGTINWLRHIRNEKIRTAVKKNFRDRLALMYLGDWVYAGIHHCFFLLVEASNQMLSLFVSTGYLYRIFNIDPSPVSCGSFFNAPGSRSECHCKPHDMWRSHNTIYIYIYHGLIEINLLK